MAQASGHLGLATYSLWRRDMVRFFRQRSRIVSALVTPVVFWLVLGGGLNHSFSLGGEAGVGYLEYFFPGTIVMILLFTAVFSTISVIEDRREGFLQGVLVAPVDRLAIVMGKVLGGATIATLQGMLFLLAWPVVGGWQGGWMILLWVAATILIMFVLAIALTAMGLCLAWPMDSTAGFHAVMNLVLMPLWFLSGAVFPVDKASPIMRELMWFNPLTYGVASLSAAMTGGQQRVGAPLPLWISLAITLLFAVAMIALARRIVLRRRVDGLS